MYFEKVAQRLQCRLRSPVAKSVRTPRAPNVLWTNRWVCVCVCVWLDKDICSAQVEMDADDEGPRSAFEVDGELDPAEGTPPEFRYLAPRICAGPPEGSTFD